MIASPIAAIRSSRLAFGLGVTLVVAVFATRYPAAWYAYPLSGHPDEHFIVNPALKVARTLDLRVQFLNYPTFNCYVLAALYRIIDGCDLLRGGSGFLPATATADHFVVARLMVMSFSALTLVAVAELGRRLVSPAAGVFSAAFLAVAPLFTKYSYVASVNPAVALWATLSCLLAVILLEQRTRKHYALAGVCAGLTIGSKYIGATAALPVLLAHVLGPRETRRATNALLFAVVTISAFALSTPSAFILWEHFLSTLGYVRHLQENGDYPLHSSASATSYAPYASAMLSRGYLSWPSALAAVGAAWLIRKDWRRAVIVLAHPLLLFALVGAYRTYWLRNLLSVVPFLALLSGCGVYALMCGARSLLGDHRHAAALSRGLAVALALVAIGPSAQLARGELHAATLTDTRAATLDWIRASLPPGARIVREHRTPEIEAYCSDFEVQAVRSIVRPDRRAEFARDCDYVLVTYAFARNVRRAPELRAERQRYREFFEQHELVASFVGDGKSLRGATIQVYRMTR